MPDDPLDAIAESFSVLERIKTGDWPDWMLTREYPCDACETPIPGLTFKQMWEKDWEIRRDQPPMAVMFYCPKCKESNRVLQSPDPKTDPVPPRS